MRRQRVGILDRFKASAADLEELIVVTQKGAVGSLQLLNRRKPAALMGVLPYSCCGMGQELLRTGQICPPRVPQ